jgi:hypothetical protein
MTIFSCASIFVTSLPIIIFCWLPPDNPLALAEKSFGLTSNLSIIS